MKAKIKTRSFLLVAREIEKMAASQSIKDVETLEKIAVLIANNHNNKSKANINFKDGKAEI